MEELLFLLPKNMKIEQILETDNIRRYFVQKKVTIRVTESNQLQAQIAKTTSETQVDKSEALEEKYMCLVKDLN